MIAAETQQALLAHAGGNPLYAEQYVRMLAERGDPRTLPLPGTVQGIIAARLDALPDEEKTPAPQRGGDGQGVLAGRRRADRRVGAAGS